VISPGTGCLAPVASEFVIRLLGISTGMPEPRDFTVASGSFVGMDTMLRPDAPTASRTRRP
jgi:hypothetical protein